MPHDPRKSLEDMRLAAEFLLKVTAGRTVDDYRSDELLRSAVERKFEVIGEALRRLHQSDPQLAGRIPQHRQIISFRNILVHGYDIIDAQVVWDIVQQDLPTLTNEVTQLLQAMSAP